MSNFVRPEIKDGLLRAAVWLSGERCNDVCAVMLTQLVNDLVFEEWQRTHPGMMFPDERGEVMPIECTLSPLNT